MENSLVSRDHLNEFILEEYNFCRLSEAQVAAVEEHLLVCERCQAALEKEDEYIRLMKFATARPSRIPRFRGGRRAVWAAGVLAAACLAAVSLRVSIDSPHAEPLTVTLESYRGGVGPSSNQAASGHPLDLSIAAADVPAAPQYRLEVVTAGGAVLWTGQANLSSGKLSVRLPIKLSADRYWIRLYGQSELLAEYGLQIK